jgi:MoaA/NifB/PqqE/SkfB family radical SAM enzyme
MNSETNAFTEKLKKLPLHPRVYPPYRVHWNWDIAFKCNYRCSYCEVVKREQEFSYQPLDIARWRRVWDRLFDLYWCSHVRFSGGEPTAYPNFWDLVAMLLEKNTVDVTTNLSCDVREITDRIPPNSGLSISSSFHPEFAEMHAFLDKVKRLHFNGFPSTISYVGYPPHLQKIPEYKKLVESEHIYFKIIPFCGQYQGKPYPQSYTPEERMLLEGFTKDSADQHLNDMNARWYEWRVKKEDEPAKKVKKGDLCRMGQMYAKIHPDGTVTRCCAGFHGVESGAMGRIDDENFRLLDDASPCQVSFQCPCFKGMVVGQEEDKWVPLWEALEHPVYRTELMKEYARHLQGADEGSK